jgi:hypothetical protein
MSFQFTAGLKVRNYDRCQLGEIDGVRKGASELTGNGAMGTISFIEVKHFLHLSGG